MEDLLVFKKGWPGGGIGRRVGFKIQFLSGVWVRVPPRLLMSDFLQAIDFFLILFAISAIITAVTPYLDLGILSLIFVAVVGAIMWSRG